MTIKHMYGRLLFGASSVLGFVASLRLKSKQGSRSPGEREPFRLTKAMHAAAPETLRVIGAALTLAALAAAIWLALRSLRNDKKHAMSVRFEERTIMPLTPQEVQVHPGATYDLSAAASAQNSDGTAIALANFRVTGGTPGDSDAGSVPPDADPTDDALVYTASETVGATGELDLSADGDGKSFGAVLSITVVALETPVEPMVVAFVERTA